MLFLEFGWLNGTKLNSDGENDAHLLNWMCVLRAVQWVWLCWRFVWFHCGIGFLLPHGLMHGSIGMIWYFSGISGSIVWDNIPPSTGALNVSWKKGHKGGPLTFFFSFFFFFEADSSLECQIFFSSWLNLMAQGLRCFKVEYLVYKIIIFKS